MNISNQQLIKMGMTAVDAEKILQILQTLDPTHPERCWEQIKQDILVQVPIPFEVHQLLYTLIYPQYPQQPGPTWIPTQDFIEQTHIFKLMQEKKCQSYKELHQWSVENFADFWATIINTFKVKLTKPYSNMVDLSKGMTNPQWLKDAQLNIVDSCFASANSNATAIIAQNEAGHQSRVTYAELEKLSNRVANGLSTLLKKGDRVAIIMPMNIQAVAIYLGVIKAGCAVVSIPDSFAVDEIAKRMQLAEVNAVFTQDYLIRDNKTHELYQKMCQANAPLTIVLSNDNAKTVQLRAQDVFWDKFLSKNERYQSVACNPDDLINVLFSSGTTGTPKAIPWTQTTPLKCAADAYLHMDLKAGDIFCWPTSLGWMMGPWLIFACLLNKATIALFEGSPNSRKFGEFIQGAKVSQLGVVPTIVKSWRHTQCMEGFTWNAIKLFASTGETSNIDDMLYLMHLVNYKPIIEYCGGTEIGGAYITSTLVQPCAPTVFTTPALGLDIVILDDKGQQADYGEVAIIGPSIGLSTALLNKNKNHQEIYYADMPTINDRVLRRHGDEIVRLPNGYYRLLGRADNTMNLGGIKISSIEIEAVLNTLEGVYETAAVAITPEGGGPSLLVIYVVLKDPQSSELEQLKTVMQNALKTKLNPLFKIHDLVQINSLPRTLSNKIIHRELKQQYQSQS